MQCSINDLEALQHACPDLSVKELWFDDVAHNAAPTATTTCTTNTYRCATKLPLSEVALGATCGGSLSATCIAAAVLWSPIEPHLEQAMTRHCHQLQPAAQGMQCNQELTPTWQSSEQVVQVTLQYSQQTDSHQW